MLSIDEAVAYWNEKNFDEYKAILLFKTVYGVHEAVKKGLPVNLINVGGVAKKKDTKFIITSVSIGDDEAKLLKELHEQHQVEVFFQMIPDSSRVSLADALKQF